MLVFYKSSSDVIYNFCFNNIFKLQLNLKELKKYILRCRGDLGQIWVQKQTLHKNHRTQNRYFRKIRDNKTDFSQKLMTLKWTLHKNRDSKMDSLQKSDDFKKFFFIIIIINSAAQQKQINAISF